jgi:hypothetical protein
MCLMCVRAVCTEMTRRVAISWIDRPSASNWRMVRSRSLSRPGGGDDGGATETAGEEVLGCLDMPGEHQDPGQTKAQVWIVLEHSIRQRRQPARPVEIMIVQPFACHERGEAAYGVLPGLRAQRMVGRLGDQAVLLEPRARTPME